MSIPLRHLSHLPHPTPGLTITSIPFRSSFSCGGDLLDHPGDVAPRDVGERGLGVGRPYPPPDVEVVQGAGLDPDQRLVGAPQDGVGRVLVLEDLGAAVLVESYRLHASSPAGLLPYTSYLLAPHSGGRMRVKRRPEREPPGHAEEVRVVVDARPRARDEDEDGVDERERDVAEVVVPRRVRPYQPEDRPGGPARRDVERDEEERDARSRAAPPRSISPGTRPSSRRSRSASRSSRARSC